jgi:hypothetical protein
VQQLYLGMLEIQPGSGNCSLLLQPDTWRAAYQAETDTVAAVHALLDSTGKLVYQQVVSSAWDAESDEQQSEEEEEEASMPIYTDEGLKAFKVPELRAICKRYNIKQGKKKADTVANILKCSQTIHHHQTEIQQVEKAIQAGPKPDPSPLNETYGDWFNLVDLLDRKWYAVEEAHQHHSWRRKLLLAILRFAVLNCWTYATGVEHEPWLLWRVKLAKDMMEI